MSKTQVSERLNKEMLMKKLYVLKRILLYDPNFYSEKSP